MSDFLFKHEANIIASDQYTIDPDGGQFFMRIEFACPNLKEKSEMLEQEFQPIAETFSMDWQLLYVSQLKNIAIFVSKEPHCLLELLWEYQSGDLMANIALVISNHETSRETVEALGIPFYYIPANKDIRQQVEEKQIQLLEANHVDLIVLARYMQILSVISLKNMKIELLIFITHFYLLL